MNTNYTVKEFAKKLKVSERHVYELVKRGEISKVDGIGRVIRIPSSELNNITNKTSFKYNPEKVEVIKTNQVEIRRIRDTGEYVLLDIARAVGIKDSYVIAKALNKKYIRKLSVEEAQEFGLYTNQLGILLINEEGLIQYRDKTRHTVEMDEILKDLKIDKGQIKIGEAPKESKLNGLQIFTNEEFGEVRGININGEPWLIGKDISDRLEYQNGSRDINRHVDEEDRKITSIFDGTQNRDIIVINESGLYSLVLGSKKPTAKKFKRWVTSEVLPSIRKTGGYVANAPKFVNNYFNNFSIELRHEMISELEIKINQLSVDKEKIDNQLLENMKAIDKIKSTL